MRRALALAAIWSAAALACGVKAPPRPPLPEPQPAAQQDGGTPKAP